MFKTTDAESFFGADRPPGLPADATRPDFDALVSRTRTLEPSSFPLTELKTILDREHARLEASTESQDTIASIGTNTVFVVCGQQTGLFGGPLYTVYKAMHAIRLARRLAEATDRHVIPLFWTASDDHDFDEVRRTGVRTADGASQYVEYVPENIRGGVPVGDIIIDEGIETAIESLAGYLTPGDLNEHYLKILREAWQAGRRWRDAFAIQMLSLFGRHGLVLLDPRWQGVKALFRNVYKTELNDPLASARLVNEEADSFESAALRKKALRKPEGSTNLFLEADGIRHPLTWSDGRFWAGGTHYTQEEMVRIIDTEPERLSPAAALRPVCQDAVMPVAALIAGPGERLYLSQLGPLYSMFGAHRSIPWPRASFTIIDNRTVRTAEKEDVPLPRLFDGFDRIKTVLARSTFPETAERDLDNLEQSIREGFDRVEKSVSAIDPSLGNSVPKDMGRVLHITDGIRERALRAHKSALEISDRRLGSATYFLLPEGVPQERRFGLDAVFATMGEDGFDQLIDAASPGEERHRIVLPY